MGTGWWPELAGTGDHLTTDCVREQAGGQLAGTGDHLTSDCVREQAGGQSWLGPEITLPLTVYGNRLVARVGWDRRSPYH